jgi:hypothetical protein
MNFINLADNGVMFQVPVCTVMKHRIPYNAGNV